MPDNARWKSVKGVPSAVLGHSQYWNPRHYDVRGQPALASALQVLPSRPAALYRITLLHEQLHSW